MMMMMIMLMMVVIISAADDDDDDDDDGAMAVGCSGVIKVGVTRSGNWRRHLKKSTTSEVFWHSGALQIGLLLLFFFLFFFIFIFFDPGTSFPRCETFIIIIIIMF